jgi:hypothetical protein
MMVHVRIIYLNAKSAKDAKFRKGMFDLSFAFSLRAPRPLRLISDDLKVNKKSKLIPVKGNIDSAIQEVVKLAEDISILPVLVQAQMLLCRQCESFSF